MSPNRPNAKTIGWMGLDATAATGTGKAPGPSLLPASSKGVWVTGAKASTIRKPHTLDSTEKGSTRVRQRHSEPRIPDHVHQDDTEQHMPQQDQRPAEHGH